ncbi:MAG: YkgJ family cysteine cluster protein [Acidobacteriota bacterium]
MARRDLPWYHNGLRFACTQCGHCCTVEGYVWVDLSQIRAIADFLGLSVAAFSGRYVRRAGSRLSLVEKPDKTCVFWQDGCGCAVYPVRPKQCRTFPFWKRPLKSRQAWKDVVQTCPGTHLGRLYSQEEIESLLEGQRATCGGND